MSENRILDWDGMINARDLGGLKTRDGGLTRMKALVRSDTPSRLSPKGWEALHDYGIRTIITLRTLGMEEPELDFTSPYPEIATVQVPIEDVTDEEFVRLWVDTGRWGTPLYFKDTLQRWPQKHAAVVSAVARAQPGGVLFHCIRGYDRTGIISLLLLALAGVTPQEITADYELSRDSKRDEFLARIGTSSLKIITETLDWLDADAYLLGGGATSEDLATIRARFL
jgi:protein-tyrosine phosphatase